MRFNVPALDPNRTVTHEGGPAWKLPPELELYKLAMTCMLGEPRFYEGGMEQVNRLAELCQKVAPTTIQSVAVAARKDMLLRSTPLFLAVELTKKVRRTEWAKLAEQTIYEVVTRPDQMAELVAIYWRGGRHPLPAIMKRALARCFDKFDEYQLAKWDRSRNVRVRLRDVMFLVHPKPSPGKEELFRKLADDELEPPETWEVLISAAKTPEERKAAWEKLLREGRLGEMALIMNIRNMEKDGVDEDLIVKAIRGMKAKTLFPYRLFTASLYVKSRRIREALDYAFGKYAQRATPLEGRTAILVDVSGSMRAPVSRRSRVWLMQAAAALATIAAASWEDVHVFTFSNELVRVSSVEPSLDTIDAIPKSQQHGGTYLGEALRNVLKLGPWHRIVVFTDEQAHDAVPKLPPGVIGFVVNMAGYQPSIVNYRGNWELVGGFSEAALQYVAMADLFWRSLGGK